MRASGRDRVVALVCSAVLTAVLGCGGDGNRSGPSPTPTPDRTPSTTPTATATPADGIVLAHGAVGDLPAGIAWGGGRYLVAWSALAGRAQPDVVGVRLDASGDATDASPLLLSDLGSAPFLAADSAAYRSPGIAYDGSVFGVFYAGSGSVAQFGAPGQVIAFTAVPPQGGAIVPGTQLASQATVGMVASFLTPPIAAADASGGFVGVFQNVLQGIQTPKLPSVLSDVVSVRDGTVSAQAPVTLLDARPPFQGVIPTGSAPGAAGAGAVVLAAWIQTLTDIATQQPTATLSGALLSPAGDPTPVTLSTARVGAAGVAVASDGADFLVAWTSPVADGGDLVEVRALRYRAGTGPLDPDGGFVVASGPGVASLGGAAFGGGAYLVVWQENGSVRGARIATDGTTGAPFTIDPGPAGTPAVACGDTSCRVVFVRPAGGQPRGGGGPPQ
jgi:hypothetical protein